MSSFDTEAGAVEVLFPLVVTRGMRLLPSTGVIAGVGLYDEDCDDTGDGVEAIADDCGNAAVCAAVSPVGGMTTGLKGFGPREGIYLGNCVSSPSCWARAL